jgi:spermidine synthase
VPQEGRAKGPTPWFTEYYGDRGESERVLLGYQYAVERELVRTRSQYQEILVMENPVYGRMLFLDGFVMTTEKDEFVYHEMLSHVPMVVHGSARDVLIIGGGDGGILREVLRHPTVGRVDMVEIDREVVDVSREHLPVIGCSFGDPRAHLHYEDGAAFVRRTPGRYDVILVDSTEPIGPGKALYASRFYADCRDALRAGGVFAAQALSAWVQEAEQKAMFSNLRKVWPHVEPYVASIPTYPGGLWTFALCAQGPVTRTAPDEQYARRIAEGCRYYNPQIHHSAFCLPTFLRDKLKPPTGTRH